MKAMQSIHTFHASSWVSYGRNIAKKEAYGTEEAVWLNK